MANLVTDIILMNDASQQALASFSCCVRSYKQLYGGIASSTVIKLMTSNPVSIQLCFGS